MRIALLDAKTLGRVPNLEKLKKFGTLDVFENTSREEAPGRIKNYDIIISNKVKVDRQIIEGSPDLKLICKAATGVNDVDVEFAREKGIPVMNVKDYSTHSVAQTTITLILYLLNKPAYFDQYVKSGTYSENDIFTHLGREFYQLYEKRVGIIGLGAIGRQVAKILEAFGAEVVYFSTSRKHDDPVYKRLELDELLVTADIVSIHAPLNEHTQNLITYDKISLMKKTALLINTGRGGIIKEEDLARALNEDIIAGAGLDVFEREPINKDNPLLKVNNSEKLVLTPHMAWISIEARTSLIDKVCENIENFLRDQH
jgi:lactate dehydrogenase-like 2-hydroxyacid dehydrogenase